MKKYLFWTKVLIAYFWGISSFAQDREVIADLIIKVSPFKQHNLYYSFAKNDKIDFEISDQNKRNLGEFEVVQYPKAQRLSVLKSSEIKSELQINETAVYQIILKNTAATARTLNVMIKRTSDLPFNTAVKWVSVPDTSWSLTSRKGIVRYDTTLISENKWAVKNKFLAEELFLDKTQRIHSKANLKSTKSVIAFELPKDKNTKTEQRKLVSWVYWLGVDEAANHAWKRNSKIISSVIKGGASLIFTPLGAWATGLVADLSVPSMGEDIEYWIADSEESTKFIEGKTFRFYDHGKGAAGFQKFNFENKRNFSVFLKNDNIIQGLDVNFKVSALYEVTEWGNISETQTKITPIKGIIKERNPVISIVQKPTLNLEPY